MPNFELLGSLMNDMHQEFVGMFYLLLPVFFSLAVALAWFRSPSGSPEFLDIIKRSIVATILLVSFPDLSQAIMNIADAIALRVDEMNGLETVLKMAAEKSEAYTSSPMSLLLQFDDLLIAGLSVLSYIVLYVARYLTIAMYHFFWLFFMVTSPLLILFHLFEGTAQITKNLFTGMIEVACWKIVWAILGAMLTSLSFGDAYQAEGSYITLVVMNFVIAAAMLMTPMMVRSITAGGVHSMSSKLAAATLVAPSIIGKMGSMKQTARSTIGFKPFKENEGSKRNNFVKKYPRKN
ncbi:MAG TPA: hypothetical protein VNJ01_09175 [Bacteriovoracaceae bacterium]|nr:hypothetical protein [Bacteriovoracaceae bacterium]